MLPVWRKPLNLYTVPKWRNWQTRMVQVHVLARVWGFESLLRHQCSANRQFVVMIPTSFAANLAGSPKRKPGLEERVVQAAEAALSRQQYVSAIDVLCGMGLLLPMHVDSWRKGRV